MKFIHIADVHIGARPDRGFSWSTQREREVLGGFRNIIDICNKEKVDLLLIAGDLFHKQPLIRELKEVNYLFDKLTHTQVVLIAGNHDYIGERSNYKDFLWNEKVHMLTEESMDSVYLEDINTEVYGFSYHTRNIKEAKYHKVHPGCEERINILLAHGGEDNYIPIDKKILQNSGFDYIALGHIHKPQIISERMAYSGSLEPMDKNETGDRGYILGELSKIGDTSAISVQFIPSSQRKYYKLELKVDSNFTNGAIIDLIQEKITQFGLDNLYVFYLTGARDRDIHFKIEDYYNIGNIIEIVDDTIPDYDFENLFLENQDNIIGLYIKKIQESSSQDKIGEKALYYGMEALLNAKN